MKDIAEGFVLLEAELRKVSGTALLTRSAGISVNGLEILLGIDASGDKHLLLPSGGTEIHVDTSSQGVTLGPRPLLVDENPVTYIDLHCRIRQLHLVFERLTEDILTRLSQDASRPFAVCVQALEEWRSLLRTAAQGASREVIIGLTGELEVLGLLSQQDPLSALSSWTGPARAIHDFVHGPDAIEVKTISGVDDTFVSISNIDQLDPSLVRRDLYLVVVHVREDPTALSVDERIDRLLDLGLPRDGLLQRIDDYGYVYEGFHQAPTRYRARSIRAWQVNHKFPGLRRSELGETRLKGVSHVRYDLALDSAPARLDSTAFDQLMTTWVSRDS